MNGRKIHRSRLVVAVLCAILVALVAAPTFAGTVVVRRGPLGVRQRVVVRQPAQSVIVGPRNAAAIIAPQGIVVPQSVVVPSQQVIVGPQPLVIPGRHVLAPGQSPAIILR